MSKKTVKLKKYVDNVEERKSATGQDDIKPGMLLELDSDGDVKKHDDEDGNAAPLFALEDELQGKGIEETYDAEESVFVWVCVPGEQVYAILKNGENVNAGAYLASKGDGTLKEWGEPGSAGEVASRSVVAQALESVHADDEDTRIKVRAL